MYRSGSGPRDSGVGHCQQGHQQSQVGRTWDLVTKSLGPSGTRIWLGIPADRLIQRCNFSAHYPKPNFDQSLAQPEAIRWNACGDAGLAAPSPCLALPYRAVEVGVRAKLNLPQHHGWHEIPHLPLRSLRTPRFWAAGRKTSEISMRLLGNVC